MAKITGGLLSLGAGGTVAKTLTFSKWKGQPYVRQRVVPANPNTVGQQSTRNAFANASEMWKRAGPILAGPWDRLAAGQVKTGRNSFIGTFISDNRGQADLANLRMSISAKGGLASPSTVFTPVSQGFDIVINPPSLPTGWTITAAQAAAVLDQDPETGTAWRVFEAEDLTAPYTVQITGLLGTTAYAVGAWLKYAKPDGSIAYGVSVDSIETTLA